MTMADQEVVDTANELAHVFYGIHGNARPDEFKFYNATHPQEVLMWRLAREAMINLLNTDPDEARFAIDDVDGQLRHR